LLVPALRCVVGNAATDLGDTCGIACEDHTNLLQHRKSIVDKPLDTATTAAEQPPAATAAATAPEQPPAATAADTAAPEQPAATAAEQPPAATAAATAPEQPPVATAAATAAPEQPAATAAEEPPYQGKAAMAFAGGGFLSFADFFAAVVGFLNVKASTSGGGLTELFQKFDIIAGNSGGTWFYNSLVYSKSFQEIVQNSAAFPEYAGTLYNTDFQVRWLAYWRPQATGHDISNCGTLKDDVKGMNITERFPWITERFPWMNSTDIPSLVQRQGKPPTEWMDTLNGLDDALHALPKELHKSEVDGWRNVRRLRHLPYKEYDKLQKYPLDLGVEYSDFLYQLMLVSDGAHWIDAVQHLLQSAAGIDKREPMGTKKVNPWAKGKTSIMCASAITPPGVNDMDRHVAPGPVPQKVVIYNSSKQVLTYLGKDSTGNVVQPVRFSVVLGGGVHQNSTMPFCSSSYCKTFQPSYNYRGDMVPNNNNTIATNFAEAFELQAGMIPISSASAASSAAAGYTMIQTQGIVANQNCLELAVWMTNKGKGKSFNSASGLRNRMFATRLTTRQVHEAADSGLMPLVDGGFTDNSAVATSVAAGASEVLSFMDTDYVAEQTTEKTTLSVAPLFQGAPGTAGVIFGSPTYAEFMDAFNNFSELAAPANAAFLKRIKYGSVQCVTVQNEYFGIEAGRTVTLNILSIQTSNISMGTPTPGFSSIFEYGTLVQEIVSTLVDSSATPSIMESFF